jgi:hypothetical protein
MAKVKYVPVQGWLPHDKRFIGAWNSESSDYCLTNEEAQIICDKLNTEISRGEHANVIRDEDGNVI